MYYWGNQRWRGTSNVRRIAYLLSRKSAVKALQYAYKQDFDWDQPLNGMMTKFKKASRTIGQGVSGLGYFFMEKFGCVNGY